MAAIAEVLVSPEEEELRALREKVAAQERTIEVLMDRVSEHVASRGTGFALLERNIALEDAVARRTEQLEAQRAELERALEELGATQAQLLGAQNLQAIGQLAAGIAHEINTPMQYVSDNVFFMEQSISELCEMLKLTRTITASCPRVDGCGKVARLAELADLSQLDFLAAELPESAKQALQGIERVTTLVAAMKDFSHPSHGQKQPVDLNQALRSTVAISKNEWKYVSTLELELDASLPMVHCVRDEISQVVLNLIVNAAHAIGERLARERLLRPDDDLPRGHIHVRTKGTADGSKVRIEVSDDGCGIPPEIRERVFQPFFTTKPVGKGTGQGLAISRGIVCKRHGGTLTFEPNEGGGTTFVMELPISP